MIDAEYEEVRDVIRGYVDKWIPRLGLGWYRFDIDYSDEPAPTDKNGDTPTATTHTQPEYRAAAIRFYIPEIAKHWKREQWEASIVLHELSHVLVAPLAGAKKYNASAWADSEEFTVETMARAIDWTEEQILEGFTGAACHLSDKPEEASDGETHPLRSRSEKLSEFL